MYSRRMVLLLAGSVTCAAAVVTLWQWPREVERPNVVIVVSDTLRRDHLSLYGYSRETSPNLDAFAEDALVLRAVSAAPSTKPSIASLFTSRYPSQHAAIYNEHVLTDEHQTLAEVFSDAGYVTGAFVENPTLDGAFGFSQGFGTWQTDFSRHSSGDSDMAHFDEAIHGWIDARRDAPFLLYVHYIDPHSPYVAPGSYRGTFADASAPQDQPPLAVGDRGSDVDAQALVDAYDEEIRFVDGRFGALVDHLAASELLDDSIVVFTSDHGEGFGEHGFFHHSYGVFGELIRVPLVVRYPAALEPGRPELRVQTIDILPTVAELAGVPLTAQIQGRSFAAGPGGEDVLSEHLRRGWGDYSRAWITDRHKLHDFDGQYQYLFDLEVDPGEQDDLSVDMPNRSRELLSELRARVDHLPNRADPVEVELEEDSLDALRALGYVE